MGKSWIVLLLVYEILPDGLPSSQLGIVKNRAYECRVSNLSLERS